jgi:hypothetical protein
MLVLYGLTNVFLIVFFTSFAIISLSYLLAFLIKRRDSQAEPVPGNRWAMPPMATTGIKSLAKSMEN